MPRFHRCYVWLTFGILIYIYQLGFDEGDHPWLLAIGLALIIYAIEKIRFPDGRKNNENRVHRCSACGRPVGGPDELCDGPH